MAVIRQGDLARTSWKNGRGRKADIAAADGWFVGLAWLDQDAPFSDFTGFDRTCVLLQGAGFTLSVEGQGALVFAEPGTAHSFAGQSPARAELVAGGCLVFNVMTRQGEWEHRVQVDNRVPQDGYALVLRGSVRDGDQVAGPGDVLVPPHAGSGSADLLVVATQLVATRPQRASGPAPGPGAPGSAPGSGS